MSLRLPNILVLETSAELNVKYPGLQKEWSQQTYLVVGQLMSKLSGRDVVDNTTFRR